MPLHESSTRFGATSSESGSSHDLAEKASQMQNNSAAVPRLKVPAYSDGAKLSME